MPTDASPSPPSAPASFEAALAELQGIVARMESGDLPLEESLVAYQRGVQLRKFCEDKLKDAENRLAILDGDTLQPYTNDGSATANA